MGHLTDCSAIGSEEIQSSSHLYRRNGRLMRSVPLFPMMNLILPGGRHRLRITEERHISMVSACIRGSEGFGICLLDSKAGSGAAAACKHGTLVEIVDWDREGDGLLVVAVEGYQRFCVIDKSINANGLLVGEVEMLPPEQRVSVLAHHEELSALVRRVYDQMELFINYTESNITDATWVSNRLAELLPMSAEEQDNFLEMKDPLERLAMLKTIVDKYTDNGCDLSKSENSTRAA